MTWGGRKTTTTVLFVFGRRTLRGRPRWSKFAPLGLDRIFTYSLCSSRRNRKYLEKSSRNFQESRDSEIFDNYRNCAIVGYFEVLVYFEIIPKFSGNVKFIRKPEIPGEISKKISRFSRNSELSRQNCQESLRKPEIPGKPKHVEKLNIFWNRDLWIFDSFATQKIGLCDWSYLYI